MKINFTRDISRGTVNEATGSLIDTLLRTIQKANALARTPDGVYGEVCAELWYRFSGNSGPNLKGHDSFRCSVDAALTYVDGMLARLYKSGIEPPEEVFELTEAALSRVAKGEKSIPVPDRLVAHLLLMSAKNYKE